MKNPFSKKPQTETTQTPYSAVGTVKAPNMATTPAKNEKQSNIGSSNFITAGNAFFSVIMVLLLVVAGVIFAGRAAFFKPGPLSEDRIVYIEKGSSSEKIADTLEAAGAISNSLVFRQNTFGRTKQFRFGEYKIPKGASMDQIASIISSGNSITYRLSLPEGLTSEQIVIRLYENDILTGDLTSIPLEGSLLPSTYLVERGMTRGQIVELMRREQRKHLDRIWASRQPHSVAKTPEELVTLASIVEKETGKAEERARVAGVFSNRIRQGMKLQSDPTIIYGLVGGKGTLGRGILRSEIDKVTPYNTYHIPGLPPTPIANPGVAAMEAVANPMRTKELFFVADGTGGHVFAETLDQHNRNVTRWRQIEQQNKPPSQ